MFVAGNISLTTKLRRSRIFFSRDTKNAYEMIDVNVYQENLFHTKMLLKEFNLDNYLFGVKSGDIEQRERARIEKRLRKEMQELFYGRNL